MYIKINKVIKNNKGVTLLEIIVSISILVMISSVGIVKVNEIQKNASEKADKVVSANLINATNLYLLDNPNTTTINITDLKNEGYISSIPKPQSKDGDFSIEVNKDNINILIGGEKFYPKD